MKLHERLRELRTANDLTLKDLAERTQLSVSYLSDMERGRTSPSLSTLEGLAKAFGITVTDLLSGVDFAGERTSGSLPLGLKELLEDEEYRDEITDDWKQLLLRIELRGTRPTTKSDWLELYLHLKRVLE
jgi:XRE family transcriptional regulator, regulator of sulfur utilization